MLRLPRTHLLAPDVSCCAIATLDGASGMGAIVRARRRFGNERTMPLLVHPRLRQAYPQAGLPAPITLREIGTALWQSRKYVAQKGALSRLIVAACSVRHTLWQASWRRFFSGNPRVTQFLLHNDFEMATSALVSCADSRETICVQHGIPTDEFFPARATTQIVWGETSRSVYMRYAPKVHCAIDALGRGAQPQAPLPVAPVGIALLSQTHTPIYGMDLAPWFESLAYDLAQHKDAAPFHILLHPRESAACYYRGLGPSLKRGAQALLSATAPRQLVVGYCSTGLIEAALAGHYVVAMDWPMPASKGAREVCNPTTLCSNAREVLALFHALQENAGLRTEILAKQQAWLAETFVDPDEVKHVA